MFAAIVDWLNANQGAMSIVAATVTAIATAVLAVFTGRYVKLTRRMLEVQIGSALQIKRADNTAAVTNLSREAVTVLSISVNGWNVGFHPEAERRSLEPSERRIIASNTDVMEELGKQDPWEVEVIYFYTPAGQARGAHDTVTFGRTKD